MIDKSRCNAKNVTMIDKNCIFCSKRADTREHIIPRCFLNKPYPNNLPTLPSCRKCNNLFSLDEEYVMYLIDYLKSIEVNDGEFTRPKAEKAFKHNGKLEDRMIKSLEMLDDGICFNVETDRVERIAKKISMWLPFTPLPQSSTVYTTPPITTCVPNGKILVSAAIVLPSVGIVPLAVLL